MNVLGEFEELRALYGPAASHTDFTRGDRITFLDEGQVRSGVILWVCAEGTIAGRAVPLQYAVEIDDQADSFPAMVRPGQIIIVD